MADNLPNLVAVALIVLAALGTLALLAVVMLRALRQRDHEAAERQMAEAAQAAIRDVGPHRGDARHAGGPPGRIGARRQRAARFGDASSQPVDDHHAAAHRRQPAEAQRTAGGDRQRAEEHHRPRLAGHVAAERAQQQAGARRVRAGPHGDHRPGRAAERMLRIPVHAAEQEPAGLRGVPAGRPPARHRRQVSARSRHGFSRSGDRRRAQARRDAPAPGCRPACQRHRVEIPDPGRDPGHGADVRAVGVGLCRIARRVRRPVPEGLSRQGGHRLTVAADAGHSRDPADPTRCAHARGRRQDPRRGRPPDGRHRAAARARAQACRSISARPTRTCGRS